MASSGWWCISLVVLVVFANDASAQRQVKKHWQKPVSVFSLPLSSAPAPVRDQRPRQPTVRPTAEAPDPMKDQRPKQPTVRPTAEARLQRCEVEEVERVKCGTPDITASQCETINCCFDGQQCYYGKAVTMQCTRDGQFVVVVARDSTLPSLDLDSVNLPGSQDAPCSPVGTNAAFIIFQFPVTACGTTMEENEGYVIYENRMMSSFKLEVGQRGSITRDSHFELLFQCRYSSTAVEALVIEVNPVPPPASITALGPLRMELRLASGQCFTKGCVEEEEAYSSFYSVPDYPIIKVLRQPVFVEVRILERIDPVLTLTLERCWATTTPDPLSLPQWELLVDGCPFSDDRYQTTVVPVEASSGLQYPSHHKRFFLKMFTFVDRDTLVALDERVFIHCNAAACSPTANDSCEQRCTRQRRAVSTARRTARRTEESKTVSSGQVILTDPSQSLTYFVHKDNP